MKLQTKLVAVLAGALAVTAIAGCPTTAPPGTTPGGPGGALQGRLTFALNSGSNPGQPLTVRLRSRATGSSANFAVTDKTTQTDNNGNYSFTGLSAADYQVYYDDEGKVAATTFNTAGVAAADPVAVTSTQTAAQQVNLELAWDFTSAVPAPNATVTAGSQVNFDWPEKNGASGAVYQVTIFSTSNTQSGALQTFPAEGAAATQATVTLNNQVTAGTRYYVVKYWKSGGTFGGPNFYGQTKPIPIVVQ